MMWKSTAVASGIGLILTWLANVPPADAPSAGRSPAPADVSDIEAEAERLRVRVRGDFEFQEPSRDLFRFSQSVAPAAGPVVSDVAEPEAVPPPSPPSVTLSGVASDVVAGRDEWTAILNTPAGLVFAREGDTVVGLYRVGAISAEGVALIRVDDATVLQLR